MGVASDIPGVRCDLDDHGSRTEVLPDRGDARARDRRRQQVLDVHLDLCGVLSGQPVKPEVQPLRQLRPGIREQR